MAHVKSITTKLPTYLELLLHDNCNIKLVFQAGQKSQKSSKDNTVEVFDEFSELDQLDLTGTPLETDLGGNDNECETVILNQPNSWTPQEACQHPLTLKDARTFINDQLKSRKPNERIYCICDGSDPQCTVGLGTIVAPRKISRFLVHIVPCVSEYNEITSIDCMTSQHLGSLIRKGANAENVQVVIGHKDSPLIDFWEDLCLIQSYIKLMESVNTLYDTTVLSLHDNTDYSEIRSLISELFLSGTAKKIMPQTLDLKNLRQLNIIDSLWIILKQCKTLVDLRDSFHFAFEELAQQQTRILIPNENNSAVAEIIRGIVEGRVVPPALSFIQSLELLAELGLEKLKNDYFAILGSFSTAAKEECVKKWNELCSEHAFLDTKQGSQRRTRITISRKTAIMDVTNSNVKLTFLDSMHKVGEFMYLYKENLPMMERIFDSLCESLSNQFIVKFPKVVQNCDFKQARLCKFQFNISSSDADVLIKDKSPAAFTTTLRSTINRSEVWTVFHFSEKPIFPPSVFQNYEIPDVSNEIKLLYGTKLVKYVENM